MVKVKINKHRNKHGVLGIRVQFLSLLKDYFSTFSCQKHQTAHPLLGNLCVQNLQSQCQGETKLF